MSNSVIDSIQNDKREKPIIQSLFECFKHAGAVGLLHLSFIFIFHYLNPTETGVSRRKEQAQPGSHRDRMTMNPSHLSTKAGVQKTGSSHLQKKKKPTSQSRSGGAHLKTQVVRQAGPCEFKVNLVYLKFQTSQGYVVRPCLKTTINKSYLKKQNEQPHLSLNAFSLKSHQKVKKVTSYLLFHFLSRIRIFFFFFYFSDEIII